ncbi:MAG TPA: DUF2231 domain-containing protein [Actinomycetota bacterium]|nr:DUF2231 domain-containing protein [Actinomycetota bacterium]
MPRLFSVRPALTFRGRKFKGLRGFAGKPFHPPLTDIPVGAYLLAPLFDVLSYLGSGETAEHLNAAAGYLWIAGLVVSVPTILTGFWDWLKSTPKHTQAWRTANWHMAMMLLASALVVVTLVARSDDVTSAGGAVLSVVTGAIVAFGSMYGGALVYDYGFNVETSGDHPVWHESEQDVFPGRG